ncbi:MAG: pseudouridine-5'-phosphate glycosidase, partial [Proteobacteria bacterium]|nr:pseudouridine-5'-phosphate glycosidase [Pseudomonadota bacterium]
MTGKFTNQHLEVLPEIKNAIDKGQPVVALESTIISHGMPYPKNVETAREVEAT